MSAALPPSGIPEHDDHTHDSEEQGASAADLAQAFLTWFAINLVALAVAGAILSFAWNALVDLHTLTTLNFNQAFTCAVIVRVLGLTARL